MKQVLLFIVMNQVNESSIHFLFCFSIYNMLQYPFHICDSNTVIRHRYSFLFCLFHSELNIFFIKHAGTAMNDEIIVLQFFGKSVPLTISTCKPSPYFFFSIAGILTLPISSASGACVQASAIRTLLFTVS